MIIHLDLDCYFISAERTRNPYLKGKPVVVCKGGDKSIFSSDDQVSVMTEEVGAFNGLFQLERQWNGYDKESWKKEFIDENGRVRGIVIAKSYECKRYGIKTGTHLDDALRMCPNLVIIPSDHLFYQLLSGKLKTFLQTKIPILEQYSIDEFWGELKGWVKDEETLPFIASLQKEILEKFDLPISIGASSAKWIAKLATDFNKPYGLTIVPKEEIPSFVSPLPIESFPGIGKVLFKRLSAYRIKTLGEVIASKQLICGFGTIGKDIYARIIGEDNEPVLAHHDRRSIGISRNFTSTKNRDEIKRRIIILSRHLSHTITKLALYPTTYSFMIRYEGGVKSHVSKTVDRTFSETYLRELSLETLESIDTLPTYGIHHIALSTSNFMTLAKTKTFSLLHAEEDDKSKRLFEKVTKLRDKYGVDILRCGAEKLQ